MNGSNICRLTVHHVYLVYTVQARAPYGFLGARNPPFFRSKMQDFAPFFENIPGDVPRKPPLKGTGARA